MSKDNALLLWFIPKAWRIALRDALCRMEPRETETTALDLLAEMRAGVVTYFRVSDDVLERARCLLILTGRCSAWPGEE